METSPCITLHCAAYCLYHDYDRDLFFQSRKRVQFIPRVALFLWWTLFVKSYAEVDHLQNILMSQLAFSVGVETLEPIDKRAQNARNQRIASSAKSRKQCSTGPYLSLYRAPSRSLQIDRIIHTTKVWGVEVWSLC